MEARIIALEEKVNDIIDGLRPEKFNTVKVLEQKARLAVMVAEANAVNKARFEAEKATFSPKPEYRQLRQDSDDSDDSYGRKQNRGSGTKKRKKRKKRKTKKRY